MRLRKQSLGTRNLVGARVGIITRLITAHRIHKAKRWKEHRIHSNRDAYRLGFRKAEKRHV